MPKYVQITSDRVTGKRILAKNSNAVPFEPVQSSVLGARKIRKPPKDRAPVETLKTRTSTTNSLHISLDLSTVFSIFHIGHGQDFRTGPRFIMHTAFVLKEQLK